MKITILGCGSSSGVPVIGCDCAVCCSDDPKNKRLRVSVIVENIGRRILIDTSPDMRQQFLSNNINTVDAILYTHSHADHLHGIDDVRSINYHNNAPAPAYMDQTTFDDLKQRFPYILRPYDTKYGWYLPNLEPHVFEYNMPFNVVGMSVRAFGQTHGKTHSAGFRIGDFAYSTDVNALSEKSLQLLKGIDVWVVDCLRYEPTPSHSHFEQTLYWIKQLKPKLAVLTHMSHGLDYNILKTELPTGVIPAFDGMIIDID